MGSLRTLVLCAMAATPAAAFPVSPTERARVFAACAGIASAEVEHGWLTGADASAAERRRDLFLALLDAVLPDAQAGGLPEAQAMAWRIEAKAVQKDLLATASFHPAAERVRPAARAAEARAADCAALLPGA
jgi:hypothetical protein